MGKVPTFFRSSVTKVTLSFVKDIYGSILRAAYALLLLGKERHNSTIRVVQIYFDTATFDDIERDKKIKLEGQLSLIGGTMGLLTGFSIISGVEIIFYLIRLI